MGRKYVRLGQVRVSWTTINEGERKAAEKRDKPIPFSKEEKARLAEEMLQLFQRKDGE